LDRDEKTELLENFGCFLEVCRFEGEYKIALFELYGFYAEVWLNAAQDIVKIDGFGSYSRLDGYLPHIDISALYAWI